MDIPIDFAVEMGWKWDSLAYLLGVGHQAKLLAQSPLFADSKCAIVLQTWIDQGQEVTWQKLLDVLWGLGLYSTALAISEKLMESVNEQ